MSPGRPDRPELPETRATWCSSTAATLVNLAGSGWPRRRRRTPAKAKEAIDAARGAAAALPRGGGRADQGRARPAPDALRERAQPAGGQPARRATGREPAARRGALEDLDAAGLVIGIFGGSGFYRFLDDVEEVAVATPYGPPSAPRPDRRDRGDRGGLHAAPRATSTRFRRTASTTGRTSGRCARWACAGSSGRPPAAR